MTIEVKGISELPMEDVKGHEGFMARSLVDLSGKGINVRMIRVSPGGVGPVPEHKHSDSHFFLVLDGELSLTVDGVVHRISKDECVEVPGNKMHQLRNDENNVISVLAIKWS